jgi:hypothetical protein
MTATATTFPVRVMVTDAWDHVSLQVHPEMTVADMKREALARALVRPPEPAESYQVKFRGALVLDERATLRTLGVAPNSALIVLPARRRPAR